MIRGPVARGVIRSPVNAVPAPEDAPISVATGFLLQEDGTSALLQEGGTSKIETEALS